jgi:hypothetical protein
MLLFAEEASTKRLFPNRLRTRKRQKQKPRGSGCKSPYSTPHLIIVPKLGNFEILIPAKIELLELKSRCLNNSSTRFTTPPGKSTRVTRHQNCSISLSRTSSTHLHGILPFSERSKSCLSYLLISSSKCEPRWNIACELFDPKRIFDRFVKADD